MPHIKSGKVKALGTRGAKRSVSLPDVPNDRRGRRRRYEANTTGGASCARRHAAPDHRPAVQGDSAILSSPETQKLFGDQGAEVDKMTPAEFGPYIVAETANGGRS